MGQRVDTAVSESKLFTQSSRETKEQNPSLVLIILDESVIQNLRHGIGILSLRK